MMLVFTFFNADVMKFHVAAILQIKMLETIQKLERLQVNYFAQKIFQWQRNILFLQG